MIRTALVCIAKNENPYISEFVRYHLDLGFDMIYIGDNNDKDGETFTDILKPYIGDTVKIINLRGIQSKLVDNRIQSLQFTYYNTCYSVLKTEYDWIAFIDCDEFITLNGFNNIKDYLIQDKFTGYDCIRLNWQCYNDNNEINYTDKSVIERFKTPINKGLRWNECVKSIFRGNLKYQALFFNSPHASIITELKYCNNNGDPVIPDKLDSDSISRQKPSYEQAYIRHYMTKTIEEFIKYKLLRGKADQPHSERFNYKIDFFFEINDITDEKLNYIKSKGFNYEGGT